MPAADTDTTARTPRRPQTQSERVAESSERLLHAAIDLIKDKGFESVTASDIAERAGYSREMVRLRYGSKEGLLQALLETEYEPRMLQIPTAAGSGLQAAVHQIDLVIAQATADPDLLRVFFVVCFETAGPLTAFRDWMLNWEARYLTALKDAMQRGQADGSVRPDIDPSAEARRFLSEGLGRCFRWTLNPSAVSIVDELNDWRASVTQHLAAASR